MWIIALISSVLLWSWNGELFADAGSPRRALITGGCGFVGRHFTKRMCDMGMDYHY